MSVDLRKAAREIVDAIVRRRGTAEVLKAANDNHNQACRDVENRQGYLVSVMPSSTWLACDGYLFLLRSNGALEVYNNAEPGNPYPLATDGLCRALPLRVPSGPDPRD